MKKIATGIAVCLTLGILITPSVLQYFAQSALTKIQAQGHRLKVRELQGHFVGLSASSVEAWVPVPVEKGQPSMPISVELSDVDARLRWALPPRLHISAKAYHGTIDLDVPFISSHPTLSFSVENLDLSQHPQLRPAGLNSGILTTSGRELSLDPNTVRASSITLNVKQLDFTAPPLIARFTKIQSVQDASIQMTVNTTDDGAFTVDPILLDSSLLAARGKGSGKAPKSGENPTFSGTIRFELKEGEGAQLSDWLPILTNNAVDSSRRSFALILRSVPCSSSFTARMGPLCVNQTFTN